MVKRKAASTSASNNGLEGQGQGSASFKWKPEDKLRMAEYDNKISKCWELSGVSCFRSTNCAPNNLINSSLNFCVSDLDDGILNEMNLSL